MTAHIAIKDEEQIVVFKLGKEEYCVPVNQVREVQSYLEPTRIPHTPSFVEGVINLRGQIIPILDLNKRFSIGQTICNADSCFIVVEINDETLGILVDAVLEVLRVPKGTFEPPPAKVVSTINSTYIAGVGKWNQRLLILVDLAKILNTEESAEIAESVKVSV